MKFFTKVHTSLSSNKKKIITIILIAVCPFTFLLSLLVIPYLWGYRVKTPNNKLKSDDVISDRKDVSNKISSKEKSELIWYKKPLSAIMAFVIVIAVSVGGRLLGAESVSYINSNHSAISEYVSTEHNFKVNFKGQPEVERNDLDLQGYKVTQTTYGYSDGNDKYFAVSVADYPSDFDMSDTKARLQGTLNGSKSSLENPNITFSSFIKVGNYDALDGVIEGTKSGISGKVNVRDILVGQRLYQIMSAGTTGSNLDSEFIKFRDSFIIVQQQ